MYVVSYVVFVFSLANVVKYRWHDLHDRCIVWVLDCLPWHLLKQGLWLRKYTTTSITGYTSSFFSNICKLHSTKTCLGGGTGPQATTMDAPTAAHIFFCFHAPHNFTPEHRAIAASNTITLSCSILLNLARFCQGVLQVTRLMSRGAEAGTAKNFYVLSSFGPSMDKKSFSTQLHSIEKPLVSWRSLRNLHATWIYMEGIARWSTQKWVQNEKILSHADAPSWTFARGKIARLGTGDGLSQEQWVVECRGVIE